MPHLATVIEADVARTIRAAVAAKLVVTRILVCPDGMVSIETTNATETTSVEMPPKVLKVVR